MTDAVNVLLAGTDELELRKQIEQLLSDGYAVDRVSPLDSGSSTACGRPPHGNRVSRERDGLPQIQSFRAEKTWACRMISAMRVLLHHLLMGWSSNTTGYTSTYRVSYTVVYTRTKEVS